MIAELQYLQCALKSYLIFVKVLEFFHRHCGIVKLNA